jgi:hypothetical protein
MMLKEAGEFASHLRRCEKDIRALKNATEGARAGGWEPARRLCARLRLPNSYYYS